MILPFKHKWQLTLYRSVASCYIEIKYEGVDIDGFQSSSLMTAWEQVFPCAVSWRRWRVSCKWLCGNIVLSQILRGPFGLGGRNHWPENGLLKAAEEQVLKCALSR